MSGAVFHGSIDGRVIFAGNHFSGGNVTVQHVSERPDTPPNPSSTIIPYRRDPNFVPRGDFLKKIHHLCSKPAGRTALVGLGGVGKSQLAIEFAHQLKEQYTAEEDRMWVFWVHANTATRVEEAFKAIADTLKIPGRNQPSADVLRLVYGRLSDETRGRWCMILDSADDYDVLFGVKGGIYGDQPLASFLPQSPNGSILLTTRNRDMAARLTNDHQAIIEVGPMIKSEALQLLENRLETLPDVRMAADLVQALDFIPLAISQAAAYIQARTPRTSLEGYLADFRKSESERVFLLGHDAGDLQRDGSASNAILTTWELSFNHICSRRLSAANLLSLMSLFNRQDIPEWLLKCHRNIASVEQASLNGRADSESEMRGGCLLSLIGLFKRQGIPERSLKSSKSPLRAPQETLRGDTHSESDGDHGGMDHRFEDDIAMLRDYCLVSVTEGGDMFEMHRLVQLSTREWLKAKNLYETFEEQYIMLLQKWLPTGEYENWETCRILFPHAEVAAKYQPKKEGVKDIWASVLYKGGWYAISQGMYEIAEQMLSQATYVYERRVGKEESITLSSMSILAWVYKDQGRWEEAEKLFVQVMEMSKTKLGVDHPDTMTSMANLASTFWNQGRWEEAEKLQVQVMETRKTKLGVDHPDTLSSMANLASIYRNQGRWEEAEKLQVQVMEMSKTKLGVDHPDTLTSMANLASTFWKQGRWEEAEKLFVQVIETSKTKLGVDHPDTLNNMANLALTFWKQGRWEEAEKLEVQVMETHKTKLGVDHPDTLTSMANLASTFWKQGRWEEAEKLFVQVIETSKTKLGVDHPDTLTSMANLASTYMNQGRWKEAEKLQMQVIETRKTKLGVDHPDTLTSMANLASTFWKQGRWEEAEKLFVQVIETSKTKLGVDHPDTLNNMANLASTFWKQGRWEEAEKLQMQVMETRKTKLGVDHPDTMTSMANLAWTWKSQGRDDDALVLMQRCALAQERVLAKNHPDAISNLSTLHNWKG